MNIKSTATVVSLIGNLISSELTNSKSENTKDNKNPIGDLIKEIELLDVTEDVDKLKGSLIASCESLALRSSELHLASESCFQAYAESVDVYDRSDGSIDDEKDVVEAEKAHNESKVILEYHKVKSVEAIDALETSLGDFKRAVVSHEYDESSLSH